MELNLFQGCLFYNPIQLRPAAVMVSFLILKNISTLCSYGRNRLSPL
jgi:hypothetical protein